MRPPDAFGELRARRDELRAVLAKVVPLRPLQSERLEDGTVQTFTTMLRGALGSDGPVSRSYLRFLVERIEVRRKGENRHVKTVARRGNAMRLLHGFEDGNGKPPGATSEGMPPGGVRTCVASQLRMGSGPLPLSDGARRDTHSAALLAVPFSASPSPRARSVC